MTEKVKRNFWVKKENWERLVQMAGLTERNIGAMADVCIQEAWERRSLDTVDGDSPLPLDTLGVREEVELRR